MDSASVLAVKPVLVGGGTDGASVNVGQHNGMKGKCSSLVILGMVVCSSSRTGIQEGSNKFAVS